MRSDIEKVLTQNGRCGAAYWNKQHNFYRKAKRFKLDADLEVDDEFCCRVMPMRSKHIGWDGKTPSVNWSYGKRFLRSRLGLKWDDIYSEICAALKNSDVKSSLNLVKVIKSWDFAEHTFINEEGIICEKTGFSCDRHVYGFYVHPETNILCHTTTETYNSRLRRTRKEKIEEEKKSKVVINKNLQYHKLDGIWYRITMGEIPEGTHQTFDVLGDLSVPWVLSSLTNYIKRAAFTKYKVENVWAVGKATASKKEIRKYKLAK